MPTEDRPGHGDPEEYLAEEYSFDEVARGLATGTLSRTRALKLVGAALLGGALGIFGFAGSAEARRRRSSCFPCTTSNPSSYPYGYCCLTRTGGTSGCLVRSSFCENPPSGTECTCCPVGCGGTCCPEGSICCPEGSEAPCCPEGFVCCPEGSGDSCCPEGSVCTPQGCRLTCSAIPCESDDDCPPGCGCIVDEGWCLEPPI